MNNQRCIHLKEIHVNQKKNDIKNTDELIITGFLELIRKKCLCNACLHMVYMYEHVPHTGSVQSMDRGLLQLLKV